MLAEILDAMWRMKVKEPRKRRKIVGKRRDLSEDYLLKAGFLLSILLTDCTKHSLVQ